MTTVDLTHEGFIEDWDDAMAERIARENGITELTPRHWQVIHYMRSSYESTGSAPNVRLLGKASGVPVKELYALFPKGPAKLAARIAGIPKPHGCI
jgi:dissimilatory sulfite reductase related protein